MQRCGRQTDGIDFVYPMMPGRICSVHLTIDRLGFTKLGLLVGILFVFVFALYPAVVSKGVQLLLGRFETGRRHELFIFCFGCSTHKQVSVLAPWENYVP